MDKCKTCLYRASEEYKCMKCDYIGITGTMRPCEPGDECTVYKRGKRKVRRMYRFLKGVDKTEWHEEGEGP